MNFFKDKGILITGSSGMIGKELYEILVNSSYDYKFLRLADIKKGQDLRNFKTCINYTKDVDIVFLLHGVKGSPKMTKEKPASFFVPMIQSNTNMLEACRINNVEKVVYTSSIAVLNPETDLYPAFAKKAGEMQIDAYKIQYPEFGKNCFITRPANVYGKYDNFMNPDAMVITSLVRKAILDAKIEVWGDGSETREFISARDVAKGIILTMSKSPDKPVNLGSGEVHSIKEVAEILSNISGKSIIYKPFERCGDKNRVVFNDKNQADIGFKAQDNFERNIQEIYTWAKDLYLGGILK